MDNLPLRTASSDRIRSSSIEGLSRTSSTDLQNRTNLVAVKAIKTSEWIFVKAQAILGHKYVQLKTENNETVFVKINHITKKLGWTKAEVKGAFSGAGGLARLQEAFALKDMITPNAEEKVFNKVDEGTGSDRTSVTTRESSDDFDDVEGRSAECGKSFILDDKLNISESILLNKDRFHDINEVAESCLNALKHDDKSVIIWYKESGKSTSCLASVIIIDPKKLTVDIGSSIAKGSAGHIFNIADTAVKIHNIEGIISGGETLQSYEDDIRKEVSFLKDMGLYPGIQKTGEIEEVHQITYIGAPESIRDTGKLHIMKSYKYDGDASDFITKHSEDTDYKTKVISMQERIMGGYEYIHSKGIFHLDGKPQNYFYKKEDAGFILDVGDFGGAVQIKEDGVSKVPENFGGTSLYTPASLRLKYDEQSERTNTLINKGASGAEIKAAQKACAGILKEVDDFQKAVTLYQMCVGKTDVFPYTRTTFKGGEPDKLDLDGVSKELEIFYGQKNHPIATHILAVLLKKLPLTH